MVGITQTLRTMPPKLKLPWGNPPKPNLWVCKLIPAPKDIGPVGGGVLYYEIKSPVLNVENGYRSLKMKFAWTGVQPVIVDVFGGNGIRLVNMLEIPQYITLEEALVRVWKKITWHYTNQEVFFNTKVASKKKTKAKKRKENPKSIDRYVKEYAEQRGYDSADNIPSNEKGKAFAIAWSRYCSKRPGSPRCKKDKGYFPNRPNIAKGIAKSVADKRRKRTKKKASAFSVADRHIKVASGSPSTLRDLFVKEYKSIKLSWGTPPKPNLWKTTLVMNGDFNGNPRIIYLVESPFLLKPIQIIFEKYSHIDINGQRDEFVNVGVYSSDSFRPLVDVKPNSSADFDKTMGLIWFYFFSKHKQLFKPGTKVASESPTLLIDLFGNKDYKELNLNWGRPAKPNVWKCRLIGTSDKIKTYRVSSPFLLEDLTLSFELFDSYSGQSVNIFIQKVGENFELLAKMNPNALAEWDLISGIMWDKLMWECRGNLYQKLLKPGTKVASAGGRYGYTKKVQKDCELAVSQLQKFCRTLCSKQKSKGNRHLEFYRAHAEKSGSPFVKAFVQCHKDIYNEALSKIASSMYGYNEKTVKSCLNNINDLQIRSAMLINKLLARKTSNSDKIKAYLSEHIEQTGCIWSTCLYSCL